MLLEDKRGKYWNNNEVSLETVVTYDGHLIIPRFCLERILFEADGRKIINVMCDCVRLLLHTSDLVDRLRNSTWR